MSTKKIKQVLLEDLENLSQEDKQIHLESLKMLINKAKTQKELVKIQMTLNVLLHRDLESLAA